METGGLSETVTVTAEAPLLDTTTAITGTTVDSKQIAELPLGDGTAYMLTRLAPGIMDTSDLHFSPPDGQRQPRRHRRQRRRRAATSSRIDGAPNMSNARGVGFSPPSDAISEFKVQTNAFDAQAGHTAGAVVNLALKSGHQQPPRAGRLLQPRRQPHRRPAASRSARAATSRPASTTASTGTVSGPIIQGQDVLHGIVRAPARRAAGAGELHGAHREDARGRPQRVRRPRSTTPTRRPRAACAPPFAGNIIPADRINPVAAAYAKLLPAAEPGRHRVELLHQPAPPLRLQRR